MKLSNLGTRMTGTGNGENEQLQRPIRRFFASLRMTLMLKRQVRADYVTDMQMQERKQIPCGNDNKE